MNSFKMNWNRIYFRIKYFGWHFGNKGKNISSNLISVMQTCGIV